MKAEEGMRVRVYNASLDRTLGNATIAEVKEIYIEDLDIYISDYPSRIVLDSGGVTEGSKCWWTPIKTEAKEKKNDGKLYVKS